MEAASSAAAKIRVRIGGGDIIELDGTAKKKPRMQDIVDSLPRAQRIGV
jgi:ribosomal protein L18E